MRYCAFGHPGCLYIGHSQHEPLPGTTQVLSLEQRQVVRAIAQEEIANASARRTDLLDRLRALKDSSDPESAHSEADALLFDYISDGEIRAAFDAIPKWYA